MSSRFKLRRCFVDAVNVKLKPRLRSRNIVRPGIFAKTRLRRLRKRPQGKSLCALQGFGMKIAVTFFFERDTEHFSVQLATFARVANDWTKPCDEENLDVTCAFHSISSRWNQKQCPMPRLRPTESRIINHKDSL